MVVLVFAANGREKWRIRRDGASGYNPEVASRLIRPTIGHTQESRTSLGSILTSSPLEGCVVDGWACFTEKCSGSRRARIQGSQTFVSLNSRLERNKQEEVSCFRFRTEIRIGVRA